ncbi:MAG: hypothetical protein N2167_02770 [Flavobacteriales bacterium]|nr:hypothetical protein [Flavobacteriales bacterium]
MKLSVVNLLVISKLIARVVILSEIMQFSRENQHVIKNLPVDGST